MDKLENKNIISLDSKKRIIEYKLLNDGHYYDNLVFYLIRTKYFDKIIAKIDDVEIIYGVKVQENNNLTCSRFLFLLNSLVDIFKAKFPTIKGHFYIMETIIECNTEIIEDFFFYDYNEIDIEYENIVREKIYKLLINSFVSNTKYVPEISELLKKKKIEIYPTVDYSFEECKVIIKLMQDIVFCNGGIGIDCLFDSIEIIINNQLDSLSNTVRERKGDNYYIEKATNFYMKLYEKIFIKYEKKKPFIKYFK